MDLSKGENLTKKLIDYKKELCPLLTMINTRLFISCSSCKSKTIHTRNLQYLATEIFKVKIGISSAILTEIFKFCDNATHNLKSGQAWP